MLLSRASFDVLTHLLHAYIFAFRPSPLPPRAPSRFFFWLLLLLLLLLLLPAGAGL